MISSDDQINHKILLKNLKKLSYHPEKAIIILLDADRTLYEADPSRLLNKYADIDLNEIKQGFKDGYIYRGFYNMAKIYSQIDKADYLAYCESIANQIRLYDGVKEFIRNMVNEANIFVISSGIKRILELILEKNDLGDIPIIGGIHKDFDEYIIGRNEKGFICDHFKLLNGTIFAFGDTDVDTLMLQRADHAIIVVNHRNNWDLFPKIQNHPSLYQISFKNYIHPKIKQITFKNCTYLFKKLIER
ncbi:MAG: HAD family hydrolase [Candidatus Helarchaeota archaeon]